MVLTTLLTSRNPKYNESGLCFAIFVSWNVFRGWPGICAHVYNVVFYIDPYLLSSEQLGVHVDNDMSVEVILKCYSVHINYKNRRPPTHAVLSYFFGCMSPFQDIPPLLM